MPIMWPKDLLIPRSMTPRQINGSLSGGRAGGREQIIAGASPYWGAIFEDFGIFTREQVLTFRAIIADLDGRAGSLLMPFYDSSHSPGGDRVLLPWSEGETWGEGELWDGDVTYIKLAAAAAERAVYLDVIWNGPGPQAGQYFSIGLGFHIIKSSAPATATTATLKVWPPLHTAWPIETKLEFDDPRCLMGLETDEEGALALEGVSHGNVSLRLIEKPIPIGE